MVICLECGFEAPRLQWTHFKYKCTGRFKNGKEYMIAHPGVQVVDEDLKKRCVVTIESLSKKYGEEEGGLRFESYCKLQAETNKFEYKREKYGWTEEEFLQYNKSRAVTIENLIDRYGGESGLKVWNDYCEKQKITKSKKYIISTHGEEYYQNLCKIRTQTDDLTVIAKWHNITIEQAKEKIKTKIRGVLYSEVEAEFTESLEIAIGCELQHTSKHKPWGRYDIISKKYFVYDIKHNDCVVEFNGDYWHANPKIYESTDLIRGTEAKLLWEKDHRKINFANELGFRTYTVWEGDYMNNKTKIIDEVAKWMLNTQQLNQ